MWIESWWEAQGQGNTINFLIIYGELDKIQSILCVGHAQQELCMWCIYIYIYITHGDCETQEWTNGSQFSQD